MTESPPPPNFVRKLAARLGRSEQSVVETLQKLRRAGLLDWREETPTNDNGRPVF